MLGKVKQLERDTDVDLIVLDAPAAGHAITFLRSARGLLDAVRVGPIHNQAAEVMELLTDAERCQVVLVTLPEETPVNELVETAYSLEDQVGVALGPVVVNGLYPDRPGLAEDATGGGRRRGGGRACGRARPRPWPPPPTSAAHRVELQTEQVARLADQLPLPQLRLPFLFGAELGPAELDLLAARAGRRARPRRGRGVTGDPRAGPRRPRSIICTGSGGVGKTTVAAVLAMEGARQGRRTAVVTIDPAKRLADALGLEGLTNEPGRIEGDWPGELYALMLDTKSTFDDLVTKYAETPDQAERILENRFYTNISSALSATQEFMAMEKLYELHVESDFDLVVVDTPPTRNALDFLDAPGTLTRFLDHPLYKVVMAPTRGVLKVASVATQAFLRTVAKVVGSEVIEDAIAFFQAFQGMEEGFRNRAEHVDDLLSRGRRPASCWSPHPAGTRWRRPCSSPTRSVEADIAISALIVNRMHPRFGDGPGRGGPGAGHDPGRDRHRRPLRQPGRLPAHRRPGGGPPRRPRGQGGRRHDRPGAVPPQRRPRPRRPGRARAPDVVTWSTPRNRRQNRASRRIVPTGSVTHVNRRQNRRNLPDPRPPVSLRYSGSRLRPSARALAARSSTVSVTATMRSKPVVWRRRVRVGRPQATATSPPASRVRRMPPMSAPRPAESMNGTSDRSISRWRASVSSARDSRKVPTV